MKLFSFLKKANQGAEITAWRDITIKWQEIIKSVILLSVQYSSLLWHSECPWQEILPIKRGRILLYGCYILHNGHTLSTFKMVFLMRHENYIILCLSTKLSGSNKSNTNIIFFFDYKLSVAVICCLVVLTETSNIDTYLYYSIF